MNRKLLFLLFTLPFLASTGLSQSIQVLQFNETIFDFGTFKEEEGAVLHEFKFVNVSDRPILIAHVKASCGCTTPGWSRDTIPVGGTGFVQAQYEPRGRPGAFNKYLTVTSMPIGPPVKLYIKGNVNPRPVTIEDELPVEMGDLRVKFRILNLGRVKLVDTPVVREFDVYNQGDSVLTFLEEVEKPDHVEVAFEPQMLSPMGRGKIIVTYHPMKLNDLGFQNENISFTTSEQGDAGRKSFSLYTNIEEQFPSMTQEQLDEAPLITYDKLEFDFGRVKPSSELKTTFTLTNVGKEDLIIRKIQSNCSCVLADVNDKVIAPGKSTTLEVLFNTRARRSSQQKAITLYTNSPKKPISRVIVKAYVETN